MKRLLIFIGLLTIGEVGIAKADTIAQCGAMKGYAYYYPNPFIKEKDYGFGEDGISSGSFLIVLIDQKYDVIYTDATGVTSSSKADGAHVIPIGDNPEFLVLFIGYPGATGEIYSFHKASKTLTMLQHKFTGLIPSSKLMVANCW